MIIKEITIENYKGITDEITLPIGSKIIPIVGMNESGKTTIIEAIYAFDKDNDDLNGGSHVNNIKNQNSIINNKDSKISFHIKDELAPYFISCLEEQMETIYEGINRKCSRLLEVSDIKENLKNQLIEIKNVIEDSRAQKKGRLYKGTFEKFNTLLTTLSNNEEYLEIKELEDNEEEQSIKKYLEELEIIEVFRNHTDHLSKVNDYILTRVFPKGSKDQSYYILKSEMLLEVDDNSLHKELINEIIKSILSSLPQLIYIDEFSKSPESRIPLNKKDGNWYKIFDNVFKQVSFSEHQEEMDIQKFLKLEDNAQEMFLESVSYAMSSIFENAWKDVKTDKESIKFRLAIKTETETFIDLETNEEKEGIVNVLSVRIEEVKEGRSLGISELTNRSKGFIWYYNFIMNTNFIPNSKNNTNGTIFLIDEPGAYLHSTAQTELLNNLVQQAEESYIIYTTHSPALLNPDIVPSNNILIAHKEEKNIKVSNITNYKLNITNKDKTHALEAVYEALRIPMYDRQYTESIKVVCVEGIYDLYFLKLFCKLDEDVKIFPGTGAQSIYKNISYFITYGIPYLCIWDNDKEGNDSLKKAQNFYGPIESEKMITLSICENQVTEMETILGKNEIEKILDKLELNKTDDLKQNYQNMLLELLYRRDEKMMENIISNLESDTTIKIKKLESEISQKLK